MRCSHFGLEDMRVERSCRSGPYWCGITHVLIYVSIASNTSSYNEYDLIAIISTFFFCQLPHQLIATCSLGLEVRRGPARRARRPVTGAEKYSAIDDGTFTGSFREFKKSRNSDNT